MSERGVSQAKIDALLHQAGVAVQPTAQPSAEAAPPGARGPAKEEVTVQTAQFPQLQSGKAAQGTSIDFILDVPVSVTVELGRTTMMIRDVVGLGAGSVIELKKLAGEPVDLLVNSKLVARGEVVVINESFGVKVIDIVSAEQRIRTLG